MIMCQKIFKKAGAGAMKKSKTIAVDSGALDSEERALLASIEKGEWQSVKNLKKEKARARLAAKNYFSKHSYTIHRSKGM